MGASVCVCNIMLSRRGVAGSNRSTPRSRPRWVISHSLGNSPYTHTQTHTHTHTHTFVYTHTHTGSKTWHIWPVFRKTYMLMQSFRQGGAHESTASTHPVGFSQSFTVLSRFCRRLWLKRHAVSTSLIRCVYCKGLQETIHLTVNLLKCPPFTIKRDKEKQQILKPKKPKL